MLRERYNLKLNHHSYFHISKLKASSAKSTILSVDGMSGVGMKSRKTSQYSQVPSGNHLAPGSVGMAWQRNFQDQVDGQEQEREMGGTKA